MASREPTAIERLAARKVLMHYRKQAHKLAEVTDQEKPSEWADSIDVCIELLKDDPKKTMDDYLAEYEAGR